MITLQNVTKQFGEKMVLKSISFSIEPKEFLCITGPSGAGKSTLIHILIGAETFDKGSVQVDGVELQDIPRHALQLYRRRVGMIFQDYKLLWNRTVRENIAFPLEVCGTSDRVLSKRTGEVLEQMHLEEQADTLCCALSGGEKARTAIARAIVHKPMIILADEPTGNLDPQESLRIMQLFKDIHSQGATILLATHDTPIVDALNTRVITLENGAIARDSIGKYEEISREEGEKESSVASTVDQVIEDKKEIKEKEEKGKRKGGKKSSVKIVSTSR